jgi:hypothetical protein
MLRVIQVLALASALLLTGCTSTVTPKPVQSSQPSFDGNIQTSGVLGRLPDGSWVVTPHWLERYQAMIRDYGAYFAPPLKPANGVSLGWGLVTASSQAVTDFETMNRWRKAGKPPK